MERKVHDKKVLGRVAWLAIPELGIKRIYARVDTGAHHNTLHCEGIVLESRGGKDILKFTITDTQKTHYGRRKIKPTEVITTDFEAVTVRTSSGHEQIRYIVPLTVEVMGETYENELFTLSDRSSMIFPVLLGRRFLKGRFIVDVEQMVAGVSLPGRMK